MTVVILIGTGALVLGVGALAWLRWRKGERQDD